MGIGTYGFTVGISSPLKLGPWDVEIYAIGDNGFTTIASNPFKFNQRTTQLTTPTFTIGYSNESFIPTGMINVIITKASEHALGYNYTIGGSTNFSETISYSYNPNSAGEYIVSVFAEGGAFSGTVPGEAIYYTSSQIAGGTSSYLINLLTQPNASTIVAYQDGYISWGIVDKAIGYEYVIAFDNQPFSDIETTTQNKSKTMSFADHTRIRIKVRAKGNNTSIITSAWSVEIEIALK